MSRDETPGPGRRELLRLGYALLFWRLRPDGAVPGAAAFALHRRSHYGAVVGVLLALSLVETVGLHLALHPSHPTGANLLLALQIYAMLFLWGDYQALRLRPIVVDDRLVRLHVGLRREARVPRDTIARFEPLPPSGEPTGRPDYARFTVLGPPERLLQLKSPVPVGRGRAASCIGLSVDDPAAFARALALPQ